MTHLNDSQPNCRYTHNGRGSSIRIELRRLARTPSQIAQPPEAESLVSLVPEAATVAAIFILKIPSNSNWVWPSHRSRMAAGEPGSLFSKVFNSGNLPRPCHDGGNALKLGPQSHHWCFGFRSSMCEGHPLNHVYLRNV